MEPSKVKITVAVAHEEKLVSGLTKRTTCEDVVRALLQEVAGGRARPAKPPAAAAAPHHGAYCIVERWRGMDRVLPPRTKLLRLWTAWAGEQENVRFSLRRAGRQQGPSAPRAAEARVVKSKEGQRQQQRCSAPADDCRADGGLQEKQRRVVRKAFRKLARVNRRRTRAAAPADREPSPVERLETLVRVVLSQDQTIREQEERIRTVDEEIERREARIHTDRCEREGADYVQEAYLRGVDAEATPPERPAQPGRGGAEAVGDDGDGGGGGGETFPREYTVKCEAIARLQDQLLYYEELAARLSAEIREERGGADRITDGDDAAEAAGAYETAGERRAAARRAPCRRQAANGPHQAGAELTDSPPGGAAEKSAAVQAETSAVERDLYRCQATLQCRAREYDYLAGLLSAIRVQEGDALSISDTGEERGGGGCGDAARPHAATLGFAADVFAASPSLSVETKGEANDNDSDTGLSSMHSQDSDTVLYMESLV